MKVQLLVTETKVVEVEASLPHYYKQELDVDTECIIYGKIEEASSSSIKIKRYGKNEEIELEKEHYTSIAASGKSSYFKEQYKSSRQEYEEAKEKALRLLNEDL